MKFQLLRNYFPEIFISLFSLLMSGFMLRYVIQANLMRALTDQSAHLNFARLPIDSLTPGISQLGFWPPLLHILMAPFASIPYLYTTGLAAYLTLLPFLILAAIFLYKICFLFSKNKIISTFSSVLFLLNPYILYYSVTPMSEVLFISTLLGASYFMLLWLQSKKLTHLLVTGIFITLACISRYEGLMLLPIASLIVLGTLLKEKKKYAEIEATYLLFVLLAVTGLISIALYSWVFSGNPTTFAGGGWWLRSTLEEAAKAKQDIGKSFLYIITASYYMFGKTLVYTSAFSFIAILLLLRQKKTQILALGSMLFSPFLFEAMAFYKGIPLLLPEFPLPYKVYVNERLITDAFLNERYGLYWIGFVILIPILATYFFFFKKWRYRAARYLSYTLGVLSLLTLLTLQTSLFYQTVQIEQFKTIKNNLGAPSKEQFDLARFLQQNYDYGYILVTRVDNDPVLVGANIPLKNYIHEGNFRYFDQAIKQPWFFTRWVIMYNQDDPRADRWSKRTEAVSLKWSESKIFDQYYTLVFENDKKRLYRLNEGLLKNQTEKNGYETEYIPSLMTQQVPWDTETIYDEMGINVKTIVESGTEPVKLNSAKETLQLQLNKFYADALRTYYSRGFFINDQQIGNSESQSYALLQSLWADDKETFQKIWSWTKEHLQRKEDFLFAWQFKYNEKTQRVTLLDRNPATDADTDIAYALILAGEKWNNENYLSEAKHIIPNIYNIETTTVLGQRYVLGGNWANWPHLIVINPSYFSPHAYSKFQTYDTKNNWEALKKDSYKILQDIRDNKIRGNQDNSLPPDWVAVNKYSGQMTPFGKKGSSFDYSYDAFRTFWRVGQDYLIYKNPDALTYLKQTTIFKDDWRINNSVCSVYKFSNKTTVCESAISPLAAPLVLFTVDDSKLAENLISKYYVKENKFTLSDSAPFYDKSWFWFGLRFFADYQEGKNE